MTPTDDQNKHQELTPSAPKPAPREVSWRLSRSGMEKVGAKLERLRRENYMTREAAAKALGMPKGRLNKIERGTYVQFDLMLLKRLCKVYGTSVEAFLRTYMYIWDDDYAKPG
jgi:DNA-binding XRE family transcriptional regulator